MDPQPGHGSEHTIIGKWRWVKSQGGFAGMTIFPTPTQQSSFQFNADSTVVNIETNSAGTHTRSSVFHTSSIPPTYDSFKLQMEMVDIRATQLFKFSNDSLVLSDYMISDGFVSWYVRELY
jgi:hypothetical protein